MSKMPGRFPREKLATARAEQVWPFLQEVVVDLRIESPVHRLDAYDKSLRKVPFQFARVGMVEGKEAESVAFLSIAGKMNCLSFSIPAGNPEIMGTCFMEGGQAKTYICRYCYAGKGNYIYPLIQAQQAARLKWANQALDAGDFVDKVSTALDYSYGTDLSSIGVDANKFFRLHDSGDFYSPDYLAGWFDVIRNFPRINFWAPTRMWKRPEFSDWIDAAGGVPENLALRPSSLHINTKAPEVEGLSAGTTVHERKIGSFGTLRRKGYAGFFVQIEGKNTWECPAYRSGSASCLGAKDVGITAGSPYGCRLCWTGKGADVSYRGH